jgi:hypothetical protein
MRIFIIFIAFLFITLPFTFNGQKRYNQFSEPVFVSDPAKKDKKEKDCQPQDLGDVFRKLFAKNKEKKPREPKQFSYLILPNISSNPANGFLLGIGGTLAWYLGPRETTRISLVAFSAAVTTEQQFISFVKTNIYTKENVFFLQGDWRYYHYRLPTYGLGTNSPPDSMDYQGNSGWLGIVTQGLQGAYPMLYDYVKFHETVSRKVFEDFYLGIGYHLDFFWNISDESLSLEYPPVLTPHWGYSRKYDFDTTRYVLSGLGLNLVYDSRDNLINPYKGFFVNVNYRFNQTWLGSDQNSSTLWAEFRTYVGLSRKTPRHLIGFWLFGDFQVTGYRPYLTLMATGEDQKARSGRGYIAGRFRGEHMVYGEVEYRFPISQCSGVIGGVVFVNATTTSNLARENETVGVQPVRLFQYVMPSIGFGIRIMINKYTRLNLNLDFGIGVNSNGFYFSGTETF